MWSKLKEEIIEEEEIEPKSEKEKEVFWDRNSLGVLEDPYFLKVALLIMIILDILLCGCLMLKRTGRCQCGKQVKPDTGDVARQLSSKTVTYWGGKSVHP